jgi:hypothetical protein
MSELVVLVFLFCTTLIFGYFFYSIEKGRRLYRVLKIAHCGSCALFLVGVFHRFGVHSSRGWTSYFLINMSFYVLIMLFSSSDLPIFSVSPSTLAELKKILVLEEPELVNNEHNNGDPIGDQSCINNANSQYLQCAVNPLGDCANCKDYYPRRSHHP